MSSSDSTLTSLAWPTLPPSESNHDDSKSDLKLNDEERMSIAEEIIHKFNGSSNAYVLDQIEKGRILNELIYRRQKFN